MPDEVVIEVLGVDELAPLIEIAEAFGPPGPVGPEGFLVSKFAWGHHSFLSLWLIRKWKRPLCGCRRAALSELRAAGGQVRSGPGEGIWLYVIEAN